METITPYKKHIIKLVSDIVTIFMKPEKKDYSQIDCESVKKILVFDPMQIGDAIMLIPFLQSLRSNFR